jgi:hypothetical protein
LLQTIQAEWPVPVTVPTTPPRPPSRRGARTLLVGAVACASVFGWLLEDQIVEYSHAERVGTALAAAHDREARAARHLKALRGDVTRLTADVRSDTTTLGHDRAKLQAAQAALAGVQASAGQQAKVIGALQACLGGVQEALNALAVNDQAGAIADLTSVEASCRAGAGG